MAAPMDDIWPAIGMRFGLSIDGRALGIFTGVKGLIVENEVLLWSEGGENGFQHKLPGRALYKDVTLTRNTDKKTTSLLTWFEEARTKRTLHTAAITAYDSNEESVAVWSLKGVWPLRYTGPTLDAYVGAVGKETLDLCHSGFTVKVS